MRWSPHLEGLAANPALPAPLVDALIAGGDEEVCRCLAWRDDLSPAQVRSLAARSTDAAVCMVHRGLLRADMVDGRDERVAVALFDATGAPPQWAHALAQSPDRRIRELLAYAAHTPAEVLALLADDPDVSVVAEASLSPQMTAALADRLARHPHTRVRHALAANGATPADVLARLASAGGEPPLACPGCDGSDVPSHRWHCDGDHADALTGIQGAAAENPATPVPALIPLSHSPALWIRSAVAARPGLPQEEYARLATDPIPGVRGAVAGNPAVDEAVLRRMATDRTHDVQRRLLHNPAVPLDVLTALAATARTGPTLLPRVAAATPDELRSLARSTDPAVRMLAAHHPGLPADLVDALAGDADAKVLRAIAPDPEVSEARMRAMLTAHGTRVAGMLARNPACPADLLLRIATLRPPTKLALRETARHPGATAAALAACLADDRARPIAARHPALDPATLLTLLDDPDDDVAEAAAANPALPQAVMSALTACDPVS
ncbi:hypothetical protein [Dactylosporangium sp. NPDC005555]|uniref:hypothetical protein n=1 Tax=Dactylosporangium sp. NPDC005555 TaxID=3154889 RepID=UPI0033B716AB